MRLIESIANDMRMEDAGSDFEGNELDRQYFAALERGDEETAKRMVRAAAAEKMAGTKVVAEDGLPLVVYHGTGRDGFEKVYYGPLYCTENKRMAAGYGSFGGQTYSLFLMIKNPKTVDANFNSAEDIYGESLEDEDNYNTTSTDGFVNEAMGEDGCDGAIVYTVMDIAVGNEEFGDLYVPFNDVPQVKLANMVTKDSDGNIIPLSKRFDMSNPDIRY